jgi:phage terminase large subunit GpA-like protein
MLKDEAAGGSARWVKCYPDAENGESPLDVLSADELETWAARGSSGRQPGFFVSQLYSPFKSWAAMKADERKSSGNVLKEKVFLQQGLGLEWEETGEAPEVDMLMLRREDYPLGRVPPGGLALTCGIDVQKNYLQWEVVAWGVAMTSWGVDFGVIEGDTADEAVWESLAEMLERRRFIDPTGNGWPIEMAAVDAGYNTQWVYNFCRHRPLAMAVKGMPGPMAPLIGTPRPQEVSWRGKKITRGVMLWPVGDWQLKAEMYANLRKPGPKDGAEAFPAGYCHFSTGHDEGFFKQLTAEHLVSRIERGRERKEWVLPAGVKNEALDCRKYARAAAEHLGLGRIDEDGWRRIAAQRGLSADAQLDMAMLWTGVAAQPVQTPLESAPAAKKSDPAAPTVEQGWVGKTKDNWI